MCVLKHVSCVLGLFMPASWSVSQENFLSCYTERNVLSVKNTSQHKKSSGNSPNSSCMFYGVSVPFSIFILLRIIVLFRGGFVYSI